MKTALKTLAWLVVAVLSAPAGRAITTNFDDLAPGTNYGIGNVITSNGFQFTAVAYPSTTTIVGARTFNNAGGGGSELWMPSGTGVEWGLPAGTQFALFRYGQFYSSNGMTINGSTLPGTNISGANGLTVGGVKIAVIPASAGSNKGVVLLAGAINSLVVGGVEFAMDDAVALTAEPNPNFDGDDDMDGVDFLTWQRNFGMAGGAFVFQGDAEPDHDIDGIDFAAWKFKYGWTPTGPSWAGAVPEPGAVWLACAATALMVRRRRQRLRTSADW